MKTIFTILMAFIANFTLQAQPLIDGQDSVSQATVQADSISQATVQADSVPQATVQADFVSLPPDSTAPVPGASASGCSCLLLLLARFREAHPPPCRRPESPSSLLCPIWQDTHSHPRVPMGEGTAPFPVAALIAVAAL